MTQVPADPLDGRSTSIEVLEGAAVEIQRDQGIMCILRHDGTPVLKITGLPKPLPELAKTHFTIDITEQGAAVFHCIETPTIGIAETRVPCVGQIFASLQKSGIRTVREHARRI
jgi:hypothetical protein